MAKGSKVSTTNAEENIMEKSDDKLIINTSFVKSRYAFNLLNQIYYTVENIKKVIMNEVELEKYAEDIILLKEIKGIINLEESADSILIKLSGLLKPIEKYEPKMAKIIYGYVSNRKDISDILRFVYSNISSMEGMRRLYINIDIILEKINGLNDKSLEPIKQRLILLKSIFDKIKFYEKNFEQIVSQQEKFILERIKTIEEGIKDGSWRGFLGRGGLATESNRYIDIFINTYGNKTFADMLQRNKRKYGETQPEKWLGEEPRWQELPDSLWYMYKTLRPTMTTQINQLWQVAFRIGQSLKVVIEQGFGKNPSLTLEEVKKRLVILERNIKRHWKIKRRDFEALYVSAHLRAESALEIIKEIESKDESVKKSFDLRKSYIENKDYEAKAEKRRSLLLTYGPYASLLSGIALAAKLFENNKILQEGIAQSLKNPAEIDNNLISNLRTTMESALQSYTKLFGFVRLLGLMVDNLEIERKIQIFRGGFNA